MTSSSKHLLVEGENDRLFFALCCERVAKLSKIQVGPPSSYGARDGKNNAISLLPALLAQMQDGAITHLALVLDADAPKTDGLGFAKTWEVVTRLLNSAGYTIPDRPNKANAGLIFEHQDGLPAVGLWIMPNNCDNGFLEDFIKKALLGTEKPLLEHAVSTVAELAKPKFKAHHLSKAEVATYMAWQTTPGQGMHGTVGGQLLNFKTGLGKQFIDWLQKVYKD